MKKTILIFNIIFIMILNVNSQTTSLGVGGGIATPGYGLNLNFNLQSSDMSNLKASLKVLQSSYSNSFYSVNYNTAYLDLGYYYNIYSNNTRSFIINIGGSGTAGYEIINGGNDKLDTGEILQTTGGFVYGFTVGIESEIALTEKLSIFASIDQYYIINSYIGNFNTMASVGAKFYF